MLNGEAALSRLPVRFIRPARNQPRSVRPVAGRRGPAFPLRSQVQVQRAEGELRLHLEHDPVGIIGEPDLGLAAFREDAFRLDGRLDDDGLEGTSGNGDLLAAQYANLHRVPIRPEIPVELVRLPDLEGHRPDEIQERAVVEGVGDRRLLVLPVLYKSLLVGEDLEVALAVTPTLVQVLAEAERAEGPCVDPALEHIVDLVEERSALDAEDRVPGFTPTDVGDGLDLHAAAADLHRAEADVVDEAFSHVEWHAHTRSAGYRLRIELRRKGQGCGGENGDECTAHGFLIPGRRERVAHPNLKRVLAFARGRTRDSRVRRSYLGSRATASTRRA